MCQGSEAGVVRFLISAVASVIAALGMAVLVAIVIGVASLSPDLADLRAGRYFGPDVAMSLGDLILIALSLATAAVTFFTVWRLRR